MSTIGGQGGNTSDKGPGGDAPPVQPTSTQATATTDPVDSADHPLGSRKRQLAEMERQIASGELVSKNARKKLLKLRYQVEVLPGRRAQLDQQRKDVKVPQSASGPPIVFWQSEQCTRGGCFCQGLYSRHIMLVLAQAAKKQRKKQRAKSERAGAGEAVAAPIPFSWLSARPPVAAGSEFFKALGSPRYVAAPMVNQSELPYRMLMRRYGIDSHTHRRRLGYIAGLENLTG